MSIPKIATYPMPAANTMPTNRMDWLPDPKRAVLLIHDMQQYFINFFDPAAAPVPELISNLRALRDACDAAGIPVVYTAQPGEQPLTERGLLQPFWGPGITAKPDQTPIVDGLTPREQDIVLTKWRYSAFYRSDLLERMRAQGRDQLIIGGVYAHIGCMVTAVEAFMFDIQPFMVGDAVADFSADEHAMALRYVTQRCGVVVNTTQAVAALKPAANPLPGSYEALRAEIATLLQMPASDLMPDDNLLLLGLDSIRLMSLVEQWRAAGSETAFVELAEKPTLGDWWQLIQPQQHT
ncbi:isochorismatase [Chitinivorax sp. B]|uniref:isochorismatase family protein n=1 Tax=Chitinivorax sp. B TaxID=2502235 RepID=UPI0010F90B6C|nr:isochorismatase [Chitinivorax sp. B]